MAEIRAVIANRSGGLLRDRKGSIHSQDVDNPDAWLTAQRGIVT